MAQQAWELSVREAKAGAIALRSAPLDPAFGAEEAHAPRFVYGAMLPFAILRRVWRDPAARSAHLRAKVGQLVVVAALTSLLAAIYLVGRHFDAPESGHVGVKEWLAFLSSLYALLCGVEWAVVALSKDYDDQLARTASLLIGVPAEDPERRPRIRVDFPWMWRKGKRRLRGVIVIATGMPLIAIALVLLGGQVLYPFLVFAWSAYWLAIFSSAKSSTAWVDVGTQREPWFLRMWGFLTANMFGFRWWLPRLYGRLWRRATVSIVAPCRFFEIAPRELLGLAAARALFGIPFVYLFMRPYMRVAAARINVGAYCGFRNAAQGSSSDTRGVNQT